MAPNKKKKRGAKKKAPPSAPPASTKAAPETSIREFELAPVPLEEGTFVEIHSLQNAKHMNGQNGVVVNYNPVSERFCVKILVPPQTPNGAWSYQPVMKTIKEQNLIGICLHGSNVENCHVPGTYNTALFKDFLEPIQGYVKTMTARKAVAKGVEHFAELHTRDGFARSQEFCDHVFAAAAFLFQNGEVGGCFMSLLLAVSLKYSIIPFAKGEPVGPGSDNNNKLMRWYERLEGERDMILCLSSHLPCRCFRGEVKAEAKQMKKLYRCKNCQKQFPPSQLQWCSGCQQVRYCSRECQQDDWRDGQRETCKEIVAEIEDFKDWDDRRCNEHARPGANAVAGESFVTQMLGDMGILDVERKTEAANNNAKNV